MGMRVRLYKYETQLKVTFYLEGSQVEEIVHEYGLEDYVSTKSYLRRRHNEAVRQLGVVVLASEPQNWESSIEEHWIDLSNKLARNVDSFLKLRSFSEYAILSVTVDYIGNGFPAVQFGEEFGTILDKYDLAFSICVTDEQAQGV